MLHQTPPLYTALRVFGCKCYPSLRPYMTNKLDPKSSACVFLGYNEKYKGYRCYYPPTRKVFISRHVLFDENSFPYADLYRRFHKDSSFSLLNAWREAFLQPLSKTAQPRLDIQEELPSRRDAQVTEPVLVQEPPPTPPVESEDESDPENEDMNQGQQVVVEEVEAEEDVQVEEEAQAVHPMTTRARAGIIKPNPRYALFTIKDEFAEPNSVKAALKHKGWTASMGVEINNMEETETFELVPPADDQNPLGSRWVYNKEKFLWQCSHTKE